MSVLLRTFDRARAVAVAMSVVAAVALSAVQAGSGRVLAPSLATVSSPVYSQSHHYLIVSGFGTPLISSVQVDRSGRMSLVRPSPQPTALAPLGLAITPDGQTVYSTGVGSGTINVFRVGVNGVLMPQASDTVVVGAPVVGVAITPDGSRLFISTGPSVSPPAVATVRSYSISHTGSLSPTGAPAVSVDSPLSQIAIAPNGRSLVVSNYATSTVASFAIGSGSRLSAIGRPVATGKQPVMPAFTPDGRYVYISNESSGDLSGYAVSSSGALTPVLGSPFKAGKEPHGAVITPDGQRLYVPDATGSAILGYRIASGGRLIPLSGSPYSTPGLAGRLLLSADGHHLFAIQAIATDNPQLHSYITGYVLNSAGQPVRDGYPPVDTGIVFEDGSTAYLTPNQGPIAAVRLVGTSGASATFSASESFDPDGQVRSYVWDFGDGTRVTMSSPIITHTFRVHGTYTVTLTVVDDEGCSTSLIYEGTTVLCRGGPEARQTLRVVG